jgi:glycosyltransferase involved in cell wall biosynthesis
MAMRICFLCEGYPPVGHGGIGTFTQSLARALVRTGHEVRVLGRYFTTMPHSVYNDDQGVRVSWYRMPSANVLERARTRYKLFRTVAHWSRSGEIDLVEVPDCAGWVAGWPRLPVPVVVRFHGSLTYIAAEWGKPLNRTAYWLERAGLRRADFSCSVSQYAAVRTQQLFGLRDRQAMVLYNGIEMPVEPAPPPRSKQQIVYTGGIRVNKGIVSLLDAWPRVIEANPDAELHIFGYAPRSVASAMPVLVTSRLHAAVRERVFLHGHVDRQQLFRAFQVARAAVFPSYAEAFGLSTLEAMACGCPTVYTRRSSGPELIEHEQTGLLVEPDRPDEIARSINRLLADDALATRLGAAGRKRVAEKFSLEVLVRQNEDFYQNCLDEFEKTRSERRQAFWARRFKGAGLAHARDTRS